MTLRVRLMLTLLIVLVADGARTLGAQVAGDSVRLSMRSGPTIAGLLMARTPSEWRLAQPGTSDLIIDEASVLRREVQVVRSRSKLRSQSMWLGMLLGTAAMIAVYQVEIASQASDPGLAGLLVFPLAAAGAAGGATAGLIVGSSRAERVWREIP